MLKELDLSILDNLAEEFSQENLNLIGKKLLVQIKNYLELEPYFQNLEFIINKEPDKKQSFMDIFNIGVKKFVENKDLTLEFYNEYKNYHSFILLREIYKIFVPLEIVDYESVQLVINQIILADFDKHQHINEWRALIRGNIEQYDLLSTGINRLTAFDRIANFFKLVKSKFDPAYFFFHYIRSNKSLLSEKLESRDFDIHVIFFEEFEKLVEKEIINDELVETIRVLTRIFYKVKRYQNLLSYKSFFQEFKENNELNTDLSLRKFMNNMEWIKNSVIAPSYQLNFNALNLVLVSVYFQFNPLLLKKRILKIIENFPFLTNFLHSSRSFGLDIFANFVIPKSYIKDLIGFIRKLENFGYILNKFYIRSSKSDFEINLNYLKEYAQNQVILSPRHPQYEKRNEIELILDYRDRSKRVDLNLLDFIILDRIQWYSMTGLGFEKRNDVLQSIKFDLLNDITSERTLIKNLKHNLNEIQNSNEIKSEILDFLESNKHLSFFYIKDRLTKYVNLIVLMEDLLHKNRNIKNLFMLQDIIRESYLINTIEKSILLNDYYATSIILKEVFSFYFKDKDIYKRQVEKYQLLNQLFNLFSNIKLFNLAFMRKIILNQDLVNTIFKSKEIKLKNSYEKYKLYQLTNQKINEILNQFIDNNPPVIIPKLLNTIPILQYINDHLNLFITKSPENLKKLKKISKLFPLAKINSNQIEGIIFINIYLPFLTLVEKWKLYSFLYYKFKGDIIFANCFLTSGYLPAFSMKHFYDFQKKQFFYSKDLFEQYFLYTKNILGDKLKNISNVPNKLYLDFWSKEKEIANIIENVNRRSSNDIKTHSITHLSELMHFHLNIEDFLINHTKFKEVKKKIFFKNYVKSIKFIPAFQNFGFSCYFLYLYPTNIEKLDLKLLLINTFLNVKFPLYIGDSNALLINYIMPYERPNKSYLNRIVKSDKIVREYCLFSIKKFYAILHFDYNIDSKGWIYNSDKFKAYMQNILFNRTYNMPSPKVREYILTKDSLSSYFGPSTSEYKALIKLFNRNSLDIKSYIGTRNYDIVNAIKFLMNNKLIFPYLKLQNLNLHNKVNIILLDLKPGLIPNIIKIFSYFNYGFIYHIQGEYFINGFSKEIKFENGLMITLYLPIHEHNDFITLFYELFEHLKIDRYIIVYGLINGSILLNSIFNSLDSYFPLKNLIWSEKDMIWLNHKLFTEKFEKIYPDIFYNLGSSY